MSSLIVCHACDLVQRIEPARGSVRIRCVRCRAEIYRTHAGGLDAPIAYALCALVLFTVANAYPLVALTVNGTTRSATLTGAAYGLYQQGYTTVAVLVLFTTVLVPAGQILTALWVLTTLRRGALTPEQLAWLRTITQLRSWAMVEVFLLGALVALTKLAATADVVPGIALISYGLLMLTLSALLNATPTEQFWQWVARSRR